MRLAHTSSASLVLAITSGLLIGLAGVAAGPRVAQAAPAKPTVAVLYFDYDGKGEEMGYLRKGLTQMLVTDLSAVPGVDIVERVRLEEALAELKLNQTNKIDAKSAARVGKLLGARYLIMGGYFDLMGTLRVDARIVEVETGKVLTSIGHNRKVVEFLELEQELAGDLGKYLRDKLAGGAKSAEATDTGSGKPRGKPARKPARKPKRLLAKTAARYGKALDAIDRGDKKTARKELEKVVEEQPDFGMAAVDLASLAK